MVELAEWFGVGLDRSTNLVVRLFRYRWHRIKAPYLLHTGYELPLLLDGRKKLAKMYHEYPPMTFDGEDRFNHWVAEGLLHREEVVESFDPPPIRGYLGLRTVYYTLKGEEWRIPATKPIWEASGNSGGWNEHFERLEGMLYGYEDWQNDWHIEAWLQGGFGGPTSCCAVTSAGLAWIEAAGFRALPPAEGPALVITAYDPDPKAGLHASMLENPDHAAVIGFNVLSRYIRKIIEPGQPGPWRIQAERISELNKHLWGLAMIVVRRDGPVSSERV